MTYYDKICNCANKEPHGLPCRFASAWWCNKQKKDIRDIDNCTKWNNNNQKKNADYEEIV